MKTSSYFMPCFYYHPFIYHLAILHPRRSSSFIHHLLTSSPVILLQPSSVFSILVILLQPSSCFISYPPFLPVNIPAVLSHEPLVGLIESYDSTPYLTKGFQTHPCTLLNVFSVTVCKYFLIGQSVHTCVELFFSFSPHPTWDCRIIPTKRFFRFPVM